MSSRIAVFGGSFNPPGLHHRRIAETLSAEFDQVVIHPCGPRPDKPTNSEIDPVFRATMADLCFADVPKVEVCLDDLEQAHFSRTHELQNRYSTRGEVWHVIGSDLIAGGAERNSFIHRVWQHAEKLWQTLNFVVIARPGFEIRPHDVPPKAQVIPLDIPGSSSVVREHIYHREKVNHLVPGTINDYLERYGLYRGSIPNRSTKRIIDHPRLIIVADEWNSKAKSWAERFRKYEVSNDANCILVIGGDGSMLRAIRKYWRTRLPFFGLNAGHLGFLLNDPGSIFERGLEIEELILRQMPLLYVETKCASGGNWRTDYAFNEAWIERASGQTAWVEVKVGAHVRLPKLVCDGVLLSTAAGSTAYARSMGATPLLADTPAWILVGSNVMQPMNWKSALLSPETPVSFRALENEKRPLNGFVDGVPQGEISEMHARMSRSAAVELAFLPGHDMAEKIATIQFPRGLEMF